MSRDAYVGGSRSPRGVRLPTVDRSPSRAYPGGSPLGRKPLRQTRSGNNSPDHTYGYHHSSPYYRDEDLPSPMLEERGRPMTVGPGHHRSRSATRKKASIKVYRKKGLKSISDLRITSQNTERGHQTNVSFDTDLWDSIQDVRWPFNISVFSSPQVVPTQELDYATLAP